MTILRIEVPSPPSKAIKSDSKFRVHSKRDFDVPRVSIACAGDVEACQTDSSKNSAAVLATPSPVRYPCKRKRQSLFERRQRNFHRAETMEDTVNGDGEGRYKYGGSNSEESNWPQPHIIQSFSVPSTATLTSSQHEEQSHSDRVTLEGARRISMPIKFQDERSPSPTSSMMDIDINSDNENFCHSGPQQHSASEKHGVDFANFVTVTEIPNRKSYSSEQRLQMWNNALTLRSMAQRNMFEYNWEGRNWRKAVEEESFVEYDDGSLVHPAHCYNNQNCMFRSSSRLTAPTMKTNNHPTL